MIRTDKVCWTCYTASLHAKHNNATLGVVVQEIICFHIPQYTHDAGAGCKTQKLFPETRLSSDACSDTRTGPQGSIAPNNPLQFHPSHAARFSWSLSSAFNFVPSAPSVFPSLVAPGAVPTCHPIPLLRIRWMRWYGPSLPRSRSTAFLSWWVLRESFHSPEGSSPASQSTT